MQLGEVDTLHALQNQVDVGLVVVVQIIEENLLITLGTDTGLFDELLQELLTQSRIGIEHLGHEVLQIHDLHAVVAKSLSKSIMLSLSDLQKRDVVEQQLFERVRREVQQLFTRAMQQNLLQGLDFALDVYACHENPPYAFYAFSDFLEAERPLRTARSDCKTNFSCFTLKCNYQNFLKRNFQGDLRKR